jgi:hypothetical protein
LLGLASHVQRRSRDAVESYLRRRRRRDRDGRRGNAQHAPQAPSPAASLDLQGSKEQQAWRDNPHIHAFYDLSVATFAKGPANVDVTSFEQKAFGLFRAMATSAGGDPDAMQDHLKLIPRQVVQIVKEDPTVLDSYDNFMDAMMGPP